MFSTNECVFIVETVICRLYYEAKCASGKMNVSQFYSFKGLSAKKKSKETPQLFVTYRHLSWLSLLYN